jgi:hypothetical protein
MSATYLYRHTLMPTFDAAFELAILDEYITIGSRVWLRNRVAKVGRVEILEDASNRMASWKGRGR